MRTEQFAMVSRAAPSADVAGVSPQDTLVSIPISRSHPPSIESLPGGNDRNSASAEERNAPSILYAYLDWDSEIAEDDIAALPYAIRQYTDPFAWSDGRKTWTLVLACGSTFLAAFCAGAYTAGLDGMMEEWEVSRVVLLGALSVFTVGFAIAPMFLAPLSEV